MLVNNTIEYYFSKHFDSNLTINTNDIYSLNDIIYNNKYVNKLKNNKKNVCDKNSLCYLIDKNLTQSQKIKLGLCIEHILSDIIIHHSNLINIKQKNIKGQREKDHLFFDKINNIIYYAEIKSNINLDTEKSKMTYNKCIDIINELKDKYKNTKIKWCIVCTRYINFTDIPKFLIKKYDNINNICGVNDYFKLLNINIKFNQNEYKNFINNIVNYTFE